MPDRLFPDALRFVSPTETLKNFAFDFADDIPTSDSLNNANSTVTAVDDDGNDVTSTIVSGKNVSGTQLRATIASTTANKNYLVTFKAAMTISSEFVEKYLKVKSRSPNAVG